MEKMNSTRPSRHLTLSDRLEELEQRSSPDTSNFTIFKVPPSLRNVQKEHYEPSVVSLGPYHRGKENLQGMEDKKLRSLRKFLRDVGASLDECINMMKDLNVRAKRCYSERIEMSSDEFTDMLLLDGCFLLELLVSPTNMDYDGKEIDVMHDIWLLENQLPFFILEELFQLHLKTENSFRLDAATATLEERIYGEFEVILVNFGVHRNQLNFNCYDDHQHNHLLSLLHSWLVPSDHVIDNIINGSYRQENEKDRVRRQNIPNARELKDAGVKFRVTRENSRPMVVKFSNGILEMSHLEFYDDTLIFLRNLIAYEQCADSSSYVRDYVSFIDYLIDTPEDVAVLHQSGVLMNALGSEKEVADCVNLLGKHVCWDQENHSLRGLFDHLNKYCASRWPRHRAMLARKYFGSPWAIISLLAAAVLLLLTLLQTIYTILSY